MDDFYLICSTVVFLGGFVLAVISLRTGRYGSGRMNIGIAILGLIFQSLFLMVRGEMHGRCPITNGAEVLVFISWSTIILYLALGRAFRLSLLGMFSIPMVFLFQLMAIISLLVADPGPRPPETLDPWLELHASMSLLAYGAFGLSCVAGVMYLVQDRQLKSHKPGKIFYSLPPIRYLTQALLRLIFIGTALLTIGIVSAFFMDQFPNQVHLIVSGAVWLVYAVLLVVHMAKRLAPKQLSLSAIGLFAFAVVTLSAL